MPHQAAPLLARLLAVCLAGVVAFGVALAFPFAPGYGPSLAPAFADGEDSGEGASADTAGEAGESGISLELVSLSAATIQAGDSLTLGIELKNSSTSALQSGAIAVSLQNPAPSTRSHLVDFLAGADVGMEAIGEAGSVSVPAGGSRHLDIRLDASNLPSDSAAWGPRGIEVRAGGAADRSFLIVEPPKDIEPVPTGIIVPLTASAAEIQSQPSGAEYVANPQVPMPERLQSVARHLAFEGVTFFAPLGAQGDSVLSAGASERISLPGADADIAALVHGSNALIATALLDATGAPAYLLAPGADDAVAEAVAAGGVDAVIASSDDAPALSEGTATPGCHAMLYAGDGQLDSLIIDAAASSVLAGKLPHSATASAWASDLELSAVNQRQLTLALSAMTYLELPGQIRPQALALDRSGALSYGAVSPGTHESPLEARRLAEVASALMDAPWVRPASVSELLATDISPTARTLAASGAAEGEMSRAQISQAESALSTALPVARLVEDSAAVTRPLTELTSRLYATAWRSHPKARASELAEMRRFADSFAASVAATEISTINVIAEDTEIPVHVHNSLPVPATVNVELNSVNARLSAKGTVAATLPASSTTTVNIPVAARGSGNVEAKVRVLDASGTQIGPSQNVDVRVRAGWESTGTFILGGIAALALVAGIIRSLQRGRRSAPVPAREYSAARRDAERVKRAGANPHIHFPPIGSE